MRTVAFPCSLALLVGTLAAAAPAPRPPLAQTGLSSSAGASGPLDEASPPPAAEADENLRERLPDADQRQLRLELSNCRTALVKVGEPTCDDRAYAYETGQGLAQNTLLAAAFYEVRCEKGVQRACALLGALYADGRGVRQNLARAVELYDRACGRGFVTAACNNLGLMYASGIGVARDEARAQELFAKACSRGDALACRNVRAKGEAPAGAGAGLAPETAAALARLPAASRGALESELRGCYVGTAWRCTNRGTEYARGRGRPRDPALAAVFFEQACAHRSTVACKNLAAQLRVGRGVPRDEARATALYARACEARLGSACNALGTLALESGRPPAEALARFEQACKLQDATGCSNLGWMYERGQGVQASLARAVKQYSGSCSAGLPLACRNLGVLQAQGRGVTRDAAAAARSFERACTGGDAMGCASLGTLLLDGTGVTRDPARAVGLLERACAASMAGACVNLGWALQLGQGVARNPARAAAQYVRACELGEGLGCSNAAILYAEEGAGLDAAQAPALAQRACRLGVQAQCAAPAPGTPAPLPARAEAVASLDSAPVAPLAAATLPASAAAAGAQGSAARAPSAAPGTPATARPAAAASAEGSAAFAFLPNQPLFDVGVCAPAPAARLLPDEGALGAALEELRPHVLECLVPHESREDGALSIVRVETVVEAAGARHTVSGENLSAAGRACVEGVLRERLAALPGPAVRAQLEVRQRVDPSRSLVRPLDVRASLAQTVRRALPGLCDCYAPLRERPVPTLVAQVSSSRSARKVLEGVQARFAPAPASAEGQQLASCLTQGLARLRSEAHAHKRSEVKLPFTFRHINSGAVGSPEGTEPELQFVQLEAERSRRAAEAARAWSARLAASQTYSARVAAYEQQRREEALEELQSSCDRVVAASSTWRGVLAQQRSVDARMVELLEVLEAAGSAPTGATSGAQAVLLRTEAALAEADGVQAEDAAACPVLQELVADAPPAAR